MATEYNGSEIKSMSVDYVKRVYEATQNSVNGVDLTNEFLVLKLSKDDLGILTSPKNCKGVFCLFGLEGDSQTVIMVPHDGNDVGVSNVLINLGIL